VFALNFYVLLSVTVRKYESKWCDKCLYVFQNGSLQRRQFVRIDHIRVFVLVMPLHGFPTGGSWEKFAMFTFTVFPIFTDNLFPLLFPRFVELDVAKGKLVVVVYMVDVGYLDVVDLVTVMALDGAFVGF